MARRLIGTLIIFVLTGVFFSLGLWQLDRADQKRELVARLAASHDGAALDILDFLERPQDLVLRRVEATGHFVEPAIYLDSRKYHDRVGYQVVVPFRIAGTDEHLLVNLGWMPKPADRGVPDITMPEGEIALSGEIGTAEKGFRPGFNRPGPEQGGVWVYLDPTYLAEHQGYAVLPLVMRLETDLGDGLVRDWPEVKPDPGMHIGYAVQWFSFAAVLVIYFIWRVRVYLRQKGNHG